MFKMCATWLCVGIVVSGGAFAIGFAAAEKRQIHDSPLLSQPLLTNTANDQPKIDIPIGDPILFDILKNRQSVISGTFLEKELIDNGKSADEEFYRHLNQIASSRRDRIAPQSPLAPVDRDENYSAVLRDAANAIQERAFRFEMNQQFDVAEDLNGLAKRIFQEAGGHDVQGQSD